jgi:hypothetical protein
MMVGILLPPTKATESDARLGGVVPEPPGLFLDGSCDGLPANTLPVGDGEVISSLEARFGDFKNPLGSISDVHDVFPPWSPCPAGLITTKTAEDINRLSDEQTFIIPLREIQYVFLPAKSGCEYRLGVYGEVF